MYFRFMRFSVKMISRKMYLVIYFRKFPFPFPPKNEFSRQNDVLPAEAFFREINTIFHDFRVLCNSTNSRQFSDLGARPKRSSMKKNGRYSRSISISPKNSVNRKTTPPNNSSSNRINFHQQSLEDALQLRNVTSIENIKESEYTITVAKKIDRKLSVDLDPNDFDFSGMKNFDLEDDVFEDEEEENMTLDFVPSKFQTTNVDKLPARRLSREKNWQAFDHSGTVAQKI